MCRFLAADPLHLHLTVAAEDIAAGDHPPQTVAVEEGETVTGTSPAQAEAP